MAPRERRAKTLVGHVAERIRVSSSMRPSANRRRRCCRRGSRSGSSPRPARSCGTPPATHPSCPRSRVSRASRPISASMLAHRRRRRARLAMHRARRPIELAQRVEHRAADADARVRLETRAAIGRVIGRRLQQAEHSGLDQIRDFHRRRQPPRQVVRDPLHQFRVAASPALGVCGAGAAGLYARTPLIGPPPAGPTDVRTSRSTKNSRLPRGPSGYRPLIGLEGQFLECARRRA